MNDEFINPDDIDTIRKRFLGPNPLGDVIKQLSTGGDYSVNFNNRNFLNGILQSMFIRWLVTRSLKHL